MFDINLALCGLFLIALNLLHWRFRRTEKFFYFPTAGIPAKLYAALMVALFVTSVLFLAGIAPGILFTYIMYAYFAITQLYSIKTRNRIRRTGVAKAEPQNPSTDLNFSTWSPFQSPEVRQICANLSPAERALILDDMRQHFADDRLLKVFRFVTLLIGFGVALVKVWFGPSWLLGCALAFLIALYFVALWPEMRYMRHRSKELLCNTEFARSQGYEPEHLRTFAFPWSKNKDALPPIRNTLVHRDAIAHHEAP